jgi:hypothetical protein
MASNSSTSTQPLPVIESSPVAPPGVTPGGYRALSAFVNSSQSHTFQIFRRFGDLNARCLLYLQDELCELESSLADMDKSQEGSETRRFDAHPERPALLQQITSKITEYSQAPHRVCQLAVSDSKTYI